MGRRSGSRYLSILRGNRGTAAKTQLLGYLDGTRQVTYPGRAGDRPSKLIVWVVPFGIPLSAGVKLAQSVNSARFPTTEPFVAGFTDKAAPAAGSQIRLPGIASPRAAIITGRSATGTSGTSKLSGLPYKKYGGETVSVPFGEGDTATEKDEDSVFRIIRGRVISQSSRNGCSFVPGSYSV
jgi:hypothetical protein